MAADTNLMFIELIFSGFSTAIFTEFLQVSSSFMAEGGWGYALFSAVFLPIGIVIALTYCCTELLEKASINAGLEQMFKVFLKFAITLVIMNMSYAIVEQLIIAGNSLSQSFIYIVADSSNSAAAIMFSDLYTSMSSGWNVFQHIGMYCIIFVIFIVSFAAGLFILVASLSRLILICLYAIMAPLSMADMVVNTSNLMKFFKKQLALALQGAVMIMILYISTQLSAMYIVGGSTVLDFIQGLGLYAIFTVTSAFMVFKSGDFIKDILN